MKRLDKFLEKNEAYESAYTVKFGLDNPFYAADLCKNLESISKKHPNIQFMFYYGETSDITEKINGGNIDFGIVSHKIVENDLDVFCINPKSNSLIIPDYDIFIEVLSENFTQQYFIFRKDICSVKKDISVILTETLSRIENFSEV
ncbi:MAG: hypothetical protein Q4E74_08750 [Ruminococcus sp.]|nr:hypothetical protein [Ruminococcus sp.]